MIKSRIIAIYFIFRETQNQVEARRQRGLEADVSEETEDHEDLVFLPSIDADTTAPRNIKEFIIRYKI
jgi:hypothetical protein